MIDGNYNSQVQPFILSRADIVIWLDHSQGSKLVRLFRRTGRRTFSREVLWNSNTETFRSQFFSRDSLFVWFFKTHWKQRRRYKALFADVPEHLTLLRFRSPYEAERVLGA